MSPIIATRAGRCPPGAWAARFAALGLSLLLLAAGSAACSSGSKTGASVGGTNSSSSAGGGTGKKYTFALIQLNGDQSYFVDEASGAKDEAAKLGATVVVSNAGSSSDTFLNDVNTAIGQKVDGIVTAPPSNQLGPRIVSLASTANIPVVAIDNQFSGADGTPVAFVGIDAPAVGKLTGSQLAALYQQKGWTAADTRYLSVELPGLQTCTQRTDAEKTEFTTENPSFPSSNIIVVPYDGTTNKALDATGPVITAHPGVKHWLIASCNDDGVVGAGKALVTNGVSASDVLGAGLGGDLACQQFAPGAPNVGFAATNFIDPKLMGATTIQLLYAHVAQGKALPAITHPVVNPMTPQNYKTVNPSC